MSEMEQLISALDWSKTPLGPTSSWSPALRMMVRFLTANRFPLLLWWGPQYVSIYNDAYRPILGSKHPWALGTPVSECWSEIWHVLQPLIDTPYHGGPATWNEDIELVLNRHGTLEETHFTIAYSPVPDESVAGGIGGVLATVHEITAKVIAERRVVALRDLGARLGDVKTAEDACRIACETLATHAKDLPFALLYLLDDGRPPRLAGACGLEPADDPANPPGVDAAANPPGVDAAANPPGVDAAANPPANPPGVDAAATLPANPPGVDAWPIADVLRDQMVTVELAGRMAVPQGPWSDRPSTAVVATIPSHRAGEPAAIMVMGISARIELDAYYRDFLAVVRAQIATAIANARAYEEERRRAEALAEIDREKTAFFSNVSHEFRTPLTLMLGPLEDALAAGDGLRGESLATTHRNAVRLLKLVNSLLDFARIEAGRMQATFEPIDLAALTRETASMFRAAIEAAGLELELACEPLDEPVYVDREMWEKVLLNLLSNALKFTLTGAIAVRLEREGDHAVVTVRDTGAGIPAHELPRVFERFHRIAGMQARTHEGSGIGLALVHELIKMHGGEITVASEVGGGTTFRIALRFGTRHLAADRIAEPGTAAGRSASEAYVQEAATWEVRATEPAIAHADAPRILVVDDNADMRAYIVRLLRDRWSVDAAADGATALAMIGERRPALVITDVMMPGIDGFALVRTLRDDPSTRSTPVIMLSARAGEESRIDGLEAGADDYLIKPFSAKELMTRVATQLDLRRLRHQLETERAALDAVFAQTPIPVAIVRGAELAHDFTNPAYDELVGRAGHGFQRILRDVMSTGEPRVGHETLFELERDGKPVDRYFTFRCAPLDRERDGGRERSVIVIAQDVTPQVAANRAKDDFIAMLGHELRNPLAPMLTALQLMRMRGLESREQDVLERQVGHLSRLVDDLLDVSRIARGKIELCRRPIELVEVVMRAVELASPLIEQRRNRLDLRVPRRGLGIDGDPERLAQVVANLLTNAAKYSHANTTIALTATRVEDTVELRVKDQGVGIAPEMLERVFELFVQQRQTLDRARGGLGIGLSIARNLVALHGGTIRAYSDGPNTGTGTELVVTLPLIEIPHAIERLRTNPFSVGPHTTTASRILLVDDNDDVVLTLRTALQSLGHHVEVAHDGPSALEKARAFHPDIALLDIGLPVMDGYELARRLRQESTGTADLHLIAVTGYGQETDRRRATEAGFSRHLVKPVDLVVLAGIVKELHAR